MHAERYVTARSLAEKARGWIAEAGGSGPGPDPGRCALLVVDVQRFFAHPSGASYLPAAEAVVPRILSLLEGWRRRGLPVAFTRHCHRAGEEEGAMKGFWGSVIRCGDPDSALLADLSPGGGEPVFRKTTYDAFMGTGLEGWLRGAGCSQVLAAGFLTHLCVESTVRGAFSRDLEPFVAVDATASVSETMHVASLRAMAHGFARLLKAADALEMPSDGGG